MIHYGTTHKEAAHALEEKYNLESTLPKDYLSERDLQKYLPHTDRDHLFYAIQTHQELHAYVLSDLKLHIHPTSLFKILSNVYQEFFENIV